MLHVRVVTGSGGGPDRSILAGAPYLAATRYLPAAAYLHPPHDPGFVAIQEQAQRFGCALIGIDDGGLFDLRVLPRLLQLCRCLNVRIWHGHDYKSNLIGLLLRPFHRMALVTTAHGWVATHTKRARLYYAIDRRCLPLYDHVLCVSDDLYARISALGLPPQRCSLSHNGVEESRFRRRMPAELAPLRAARGVPPGRLVIGAVGRLSPEKGFDALIGAAAALVASGADIALWIAGEGSDRTALQAQIDRAGLADRCALLGQVDDVVALLHAVDIFALSSRREGLPNALLEAMAMQVPVVATAVAGVPAVIRDGENGLLVPAGDGQALTHALQRLVADQTLREHLAAAARQTIETRFTLAARVARETAVYDRVLAAAPLRPTRSTT